MQEHFISYQLVSLVRPHLTSEDPTVSGGLTGAGIQPAGKKDVHGGLVGSVTYEGDLGEYLPLIEFSEKAHLGKNTSFGLGKIKIQPAMEP